MVDETAFIIKGNKKHTEESIRSWFNSLCGLIEELDLHVTDVRVSRTIKPHVDKLCKEWGLGESLKSSSKIPYCGAVVYNHSLANSAIGRIVWCTRKEHQKLAAAEEKVRDLEAQLRMAEQSLEDVRDGLVAKDNKKRSFFPQPAIRG